MGYGLSGAFADLRFVWHLTNQVSTVAKSRWFVSVIVPVVASLLGCGGSKVPVAEVEGTVKVNGQPVEKIQVEFWPVGTGVRSIGMTDAAGRFKLTTDDGKRQGAAVGTHKVVLHDVGIFADARVGGRAAEDVDISQGKKPRISGDYSNPEKTTLKAEVFSGKKNQVDLQVEPFTAAPGTSGEGGKK
jgi:hypothetical protein